MTYPAGQAGGDDRAPFGVRVIVGALAALLVLGAAYLAAVRGDALLLDLAGMAKYFCL